MERSLLPAAQTQLEALMGPDVPGTTEELNAQKAEADARIKATQEHINKAKQRLQALITEAEERTQDLRAIYNAECGESIKITRALERRNRSVSVKELQSRARDREHQEAPTEKRQFIQKCPTPDCRGFMSTRWACGLCGVNICNLCGNVKPEKEEHTCRKEDVATMEELKASTRNCPSCGEGIFKIDGCDQMWCTGCHTAFSWNTGKVLDTSRIHNPHYVQWLQDHPNTAVRDAGDVGCGGIPIVAPDHALVVGGDGGKFTLDFERHLRHHQDITVPILSRPIDGSLMNLRLRFLNGEITEARWKTELMKLHKKSEYTQRVSQVVNMFLNAGSDLLRNFNDLPRVSNSASGTRAIGEMKSLCAYADTQTALLSKAFGLQAVRLGM